MAEKKSRKSNNYPTETELSEKFPNFFYPYSDVHNLKKIFRKWLFLILILFFLAQTFPLNISTMAAGITYYVSTTGSDSNDGTEAHPFRTIQKGVDSATEGDEIKIRAGTYYELLYLNNKTGVTITPYGDGEVIIDGAIQALTQTNQGNWTYEGTVLGSYPNHDVEVYSYSYNFAESIYSAMYYIMGNTISDSSYNLYWTYTGQTTFNLQHVKAREGMGGYFTPTKVYLSLGNVDPNTVALNVSRRAYTIYLNNSSNITIDGTTDKLLTIRNSGRYGILSRYGGSGNSLKNLKMINANIDFYDAGAYNNILIENNTIERRVDSNTAWNDVKQCFSTYSGSSEVPATSGCKYGRDGVYGGVGSNLSASGERNNEVGGISLAGANGGSSNIIRNNEVMGTFDGIEIGHQSATYQNMQVYNNTIHNIYDDGFLITGTTDSSVYSNTIYDTYEGCSMLGHIGGTAYVYKNVFVTDKTVNTSYNFVNGEFITDLPVGTKFYGDTGYGGVIHGLRYYYNTVYSQGTVLTVGASTADLHAHDFDFRNNIFYSLGLNVYHTGLESEGINYDSNLFYSTRGVGLNKYHDWNSYSGASYQTLAAVPMPATWLNNAENNPEFVGGDISNPNDYLRIQESSFARESNGFVLATIPSEWPDATNLNTRVSAGAYEYTDTFPPTLTSITISDSSGYTNDSTPSMSIVSSGSPTEAAFSCNGGTNWSIWMTYADTISSFNITNGAIGCIATNESKTITAKLKDAADNESTTVSDSTYYDSLAPNGGSVSYTDGFHTTTTITITVSDGSDGSGSGINTTTRILQRRIATLTESSCGSFGSWSTTTPSGSYPNFADATLVTGNCYQYRYLVSDNLGQQVTYTGGNTVKVNTSINPCIVPGSGDWTITESCSLLSNGTASGNVIVNSDVTLEILDGVTLDMDLQQYYLLVDPLGAVIIKPSGKIE